MLLIKLYDTLLSKLIKALNKAAAKGRSMATVYEQAAAEALEAAATLRAEAEQLEARAKRLEGAL